MKNTAYVLTCIVAIGAVTFLIRALPFLGARWLKEHPVVRRVGVFLPPAIMTLLLVHSVTDLSQQASAPMLPATLAVVLVLVLQGVWKQPLLSIAAGTGLYMAWLQLG